MLKEDILKGCNDIDSPFYQGGYKETINHRRTHGMSADDVFDRIVDVYKEMAEDEKVGYHFKYHLQYFPTIKKAFKEAEKKVIAQEGKKEKEKEKVYVRCYYSIIDAWLIGGSNPDLNGDEDLRRVCRWIFSECMMIHEMYGFVTH